MPSPATSKPTATRTGTVTLRTSYPGIKKLVIIASRWNHTPAGKAAIETVAGYQSALTTATAVKSIEPARRLASQSCTQCQADVKRIAKYITDGQRVTSADGRPHAILASSIFISSIDREGRAVVVFTGTEPALTLRSPNGAVVKSQTASYTATREIVNTALSRPVVEQIVFE